MRMLSAGLLAAVTLSGCLGAHDCWDTPGNAHFESDFAARPPMEEIRRLLEADGWTDFTAREEDGVDRYYSASKRVEPTDAPAVNLEVRGFVANGRVMLAVDSDVHAEDREDAERALEPLVTDLAAAFTDAFGTPERVTYRAGLVCA